MVNCGKCEKAARWRLITKTEGFGNSDAGGAAHIRYACDGHRDEVKGEMEVTIADGERACGNPLYPQFSKLGFGPVQTVPFRQ